jgi:hypothetical protein
MASLLRTDYHPVCGNALRGQLFMAAVPKVHVDRIPSLRPIQGLPRDESYGPAGVSDGERGERESPIGRIHCEY